LPDRVAGLFPSDIAFLGNESFTLKRPRRSTVEG
jgi:hypothetical protein